MIFGLLVPVRQGQSAQRSNSSTPKDEDFVLANIENTEQGSLAFPFLPDRKRSQDLRHCRRTKLESILMRKVSD